MAKKYKGFKGSGKRSVKMANYKADRLVRQYFMEYLAAGEVRRRKDGEQHE